MIWPLFKAKRPATAPTPPSSPTILWQEGGKDEFGDSRLVCTRDGKNIGYVKYVCHIREISLENWVMLDRASPQEMRGLLMGCLQALHDLMKKNGSSTLVVPYILVPSVIRLFIRLGASVRDHGTGTSCAQLDIADIERARTQYAPTTRRQSRRATACPRPKAP